MEALWQNNFYEKISNFLWFYIMHMCPRLCPRKWPAINYGSLIGPPCGSITGSLVGSVIVPARIVFQLELPLCACASRVCSSYLYLT